MKLQTISADLVLDGREPVRDGQPQRILRRPRKWAQLAHSGRAPPRLNSMALELGPLRVGSFLQQPFELTINLCGI